MDWKDQATRTTALTTLQDAINGGKVRRLFSFFTYDEEGKAVPACPLGHVLHGITGGIGSEETFLNDLEEATGLDQDQIADLSYAFEQEQVDATMVFLRMAMIPVQGA